MKSTQIRPLLLITFASVSARARAKALAFEAAEFVELLGRRTKTAVTFDGVPLADCSTISRLQKYAANRCGAGLGRFGAGVYGDARGL